MRTTRAFSGGPDRAVFRGVAASGGRGARGGSVRRVAAIVAALLAALATLVVAPARARAAEPGEDLSISVLTFGPGDHPFFKFGHNALLVRDKTQRRDIVYNFGAFHFSPGLLIDFFQGRLQYWLATRSLDGTIRDYKRENRSIEAQELELTPAQRAAIAEALAVNAREENKYYKYDYYRDNCSTRVRDAVDRVIGGKLHDVARGPAEMSWRDHTRRLVADDLPVYLGLHVAMGDLIDKPIDVWQEMFLPSKLQETLRKVRVPTPEGEKPLVKSEKTLLAAERGPLRPAPPRWLLPMLASGVALGGVFYGLAHLGRRRPAARVVFGLLASLIGLVLGFLGTLFFFFWTLTDHEVAYRNENMLQCAPWALALLVIGVGVARGKPAWLRRGKFIGLSLVGASVLGLVLKVLPWFDQNNAEIIALALPLWAGVAAGLVALDRAIAVSKASPALALAGGGHEAGASEKEPQAGKAEPAPIENAGKAISPEKSELPAAPAEKSEAPLVVAPVEKSEAPVTTAFVEKSEAPATSAFVERSEAPVTTALVERNEAPAAIAPTYRGEAPVGRVLADRGKAPMGKAPAEKGEAWVAAGASANRGEAGGGRASVQNEPGGGRVPAQNGPWGASAPVEKGVVSAVSAEKAEAPAVLAEKAEAPAGEAASAEKGEAPAGGA